MSDEESEFPETVPDNEAVYDAEIEPLMARVLEICRANKMPMLAFFQYAPNNNDGEAYFGEIAHLYPAADIRLRSPARVLT